jgi:hypothetical protein
MWPHSQQYKRFFKGFCTQKVKPNITMKRQAAPNYRKRKSKKVESNLNLGTHNQTFKQLRQLNDRNHHIPIRTTLNVNGLNSPIKRHCLMKWIKKEDPTICCLQETHLTQRNKHRLKMKSGRWFTKPMAPKNRLE